MSILKMKDVTFSYSSSGEKVLSLINKDFELGKFYAIMGKSGAGKSTLLSLLAGLDEPDVGEIIFDDDNIKDIGYTNYRRYCISLVFQNYNLIDYLTPLENIRLVNSKANADILLELGLEESQINRNVMKLSGGQQQRVSIARALMNGGEIILADEPTGALDSKSGIRVMEILNQLHEEGHTIILVTHDKGIANQANRVIEIKDGEIFNDTRLREIKKENQEDKKSVNDLKKNKFQVAKDQFFESFKMSVSAIVAHKMRSLLTMLGIIIGIASIVCVVAIGNGSQQKVLANISSLGTNTMDIFNGEGMGNRFANRIKSLSITDVDILEKQSYVDSVTPNSSSSGTIVYQNKSFSGSLKGVGADYFDVRGVTISSGRAFSKEDETDLTSVALIDENTQKSLFGENEDPIGKVILFNKKPLKIIGTVDLSNVMGMNSSELNVFAPYTVVMNKVSGEKYIGSITVKVKDDIDSQVAQKSITDLLKAKHGKKDFFIMNTDTLKKTIESTTGTMKILISSIAVISLVVGGIGVMNIMLVSVTERTKEIGIRMAIGAKEKNILQQFLLEAVLICFIGGIVGIVLSLLIGWGFNSISTSFSMIFSSFSIVMAVLFSTLVGVVFGYMPAKNAAKLDPIEALSRE